MPGQLRKDSVEISDPIEASQIYNKGYYGYPRKGGGLDLDILEAVYLFEAERLEVLHEEQRLELEELVHLAVKERADFETQFLVYRDLRQRGYVVKLDGGDFHFRVFPRGGSPTNTQTKAWVLAASERSSFRIEQMLEQAEMSERTRKELLLAVVDEEGDLTYYQAERLEPKGDIVGDPEMEPAEGLLLEECVLVFGDAQVETMAKKGFYGKKVGKYLQLSFIEAAFLMDSGRLRLRSGNTGRPIGQETFMKRAKAVQPDFRLRFAAFKDLKSRGLVVKTGFKYGTHFRVYEGDPAKHHSKYLVHAVPENYTTIWAEISRAIRLAHGVKKEVLFCRVPSPVVRYIMLKRVRP
jgi:tRNA-intron endonuclease